jgi:hypothetical protein
MRLASSDNPTQATINMIQGKLFAAAIPIASSMLIAVIKKTIHAYQAR